MSKQTIVKQISSTARSKANILYFYHSRSRQGNGFFSTGPPVFNPYEYRFLEVLSRKYDVTVVVLSRWRRSSWEKIAPEGLTVVHLRDLPLPRRTPLLATLLLETLGRAIAVAWFTHTLRPSIVIGNWITRDSGLYCALARYHPFLAVAWGSDILVEARRSLILRMLARLTLLSADGVIVDSEIQKAAVVGMGCRPSKTYSFPWGIDLRLFRRGRTKRVRRQLGWLHDKIIVSTRRHLPMYGVEYLLRAMPLILSEMKDVKLLVLGKGPLLEYHRSLARQLGIEKQVKFFGSVENHLLPAILNAADVYVSTSFSDGSSASLMEAMACGLPVVVTKIPANEEWVVHGKNGFLVKPGSSVTLAKYLVRVLQDKQLRWFMGRANLQVAKRRADWSVNSLVLEKAVSDLIAHNMPGTRRGIPTLRRS